jgi:hypothetical protein
MLRCPGESFGFLDRKFQNNGYWTTIGLARPYYLRRRPERLGPIISRVANPKATASGQSFFRTLPGQQYPISTFPGRSDMDSPAPHTLSLSAWEGDPPLRHGSLGKELSQGNAPCSSTELAACRLP